MSLSRRRFLGATTAAAAGAALGPRRGAASDALHDAIDAPARERPAGGPEPRRQTPPAGPDPWIEVLPEHLAGNVASIAATVRGRPILAVVKNNAYGLGLEEVGPVIDGLDAVAGLAVVKVDEAHRLRDAGVSKPILHMGLAGDSEARDLVRRGVALAAFTDRDSGLVRRLAAEAGAAVPVHLYFDTGMSRMGMPWRRALPWIEEMSGSGAEIQGAFMTFVEEEEFDREQLGRFRDVAARARAAGIELGRLHAASSHSVTFLPDAYLDMVRPGLILYGARVSGSEPDPARPRTPAFRLRARVVRVERIQPGDGVSYGRNYVAERPTWIATLPVGHADGYPRQAVEGCRVLVGERTYPVIGAVSASHTIVEIGKERTVEIGDLATLVGPDHPEIHPNEVSARTGRSVYDVLMHLGARLPRMVVG